MAHFENIGPARARWMTGALQWCLAWFLMLGGWSVAGVEVVAGPEVAAGTNRATITWSLDTAAGGRLRYGTEAGRLVGRSQSPVGTNHQVVIEGLRPATRYYFTLGTARGALLTNSFTTLGGSGAANTNQGAPATTSPAIPPPSVASGATPTVTLVAPPARVTWGSLRSLQDHFDRHGRDFGAKDPEDYARQAWLFLQRGKREGLPAKRDAEGVLRVFDPKTRAFGAYNRDETTKTYFKPGRRGYFEDQPGKPVDLKSLPPVGNSRKEN